MKLLCKINSFCRRSVSWACWAVIAGNTSWEGNPSSASPRPVSDVRRLCCPRPGAGGRTAREGLWVLQPRLWAGGNGSFLLSFAAGAARQAGPTADRNRGPWPAAAERLKMAPTTDRSPGGGGFCVHLSTVQVALAELELCHQAVENPPQDLTRVISMRPTWQVAACCTKHL